MPYLSTDPNAGEPVPSGLLTPGNIDLGHRPRVRNADGSISTVRSIGVNFDGKEYLIPTVTDDGRVVSNDEAVKLFQRTGKHLGVFDSPDASTAYAKQLHEDQAQSLYLSTDPDAGEPVKTPEPPPRETMNYRGLRMARQGDNVEVNPKPTDEEESELYKQWGTVGMGALAGASLGAGSVPGVAGAALRAATSPVGVGLVGGALNYAHTGDPYSAAGAALSEGLMARVGGAVVGRMIPGQSKSLLARLAHKALRSGMAAEAAPAVAKAAPTVARAAKAIAPITEEAAPVAEKAVRGAKAAAKRAKAVQEAASPLETRLRFSVMKPMEKAAEVERKVLALKDGVGKGLSAAQLGATLDELYGVGKTYGEQMAEMIFKTHGLK